jgi:very-short-patch-repair endonuclease
MATIPTTSLAFARTHLGLITTERLSADGVTRHGRSALTASGMIVPIHQGVYRFGSHPVSFEQQCLAACLAIDSLVISGTSAGRLMGLRRMPDGPVHAMVLDRKAKLDNVVIHRTNALGDDDLTIRADGMRVLRPARLVPDLARFLDDADLESVIEQLIDRRAASIPMLAASARRLRVRGRDGTARLARVLESRPAWMKPKDSDLEVRFLRALEDRGVRLTPQYALDLGGGRIVHLDGADPAARLGLEIDHVTWHGGRVDAQADKRRDRHALRVRWLIVRVTDEDVRHRLEVTADEVVEIHRQRLIDLAAALRSVA